MTTRSRGLLVSLVVLIGTLAGAQLLAPRLDRLAVGQTTEAALYLPSALLQGVRTALPPTVGPPATATATTPPTAPPSPAATETAPPGAFEPFGTIELAPVFQLDGAGENVDSMAFWEASDPADTLLLVTAKANQLVEVWQYPFAEREMPPIRHAVFGTDPAAHVNGVVVDQAGDLLYVSVGDPVSTVAVFSLPGRELLRQLVAGAVNLKSEPNLALLDLPDGAQRLYVSADHVVYVYDPASGAARGAFEPLEGVEAMAADSHHQVLYMPDENHRSGVYAYDPSGAPLLRDGTSVFGTNDIFDADGEGIVIYTCPADGRSDDGRGFIVVADQKKGGTDFELFDRRSWDHLGTLQLSGVTSTDGIASTQQASPRYPRGLFVAVDNDKNVAGIGWDEILAATGLSCAAPAVPPTSTRVPSPTTRVTEQPERTPTGTRPSTTPPRPSGGSRGYLTTPQELAAIRDQAAQGVQPHARNVAAVLSWAEKGWDYRLDATEKCKSSDDPSWADDEKGIPRLWAKALAHHLTGEERYAEEVATILGSIMEQVRQIDWDVEGRQCQLNISWAVPELVASADLIEDHWAARQCWGPPDTDSAATSIVWGSCKPLFQNWLAKVYHGISYTAAGDTSNWGAAATNAGAHIADYLWDRPDIELAHRRPEAIDGGAELRLSPAAAWRRMNEIARDRMNGYLVDYIHNKACDDFTNLGNQHDRDLPPVKSQLTERGIVPDDARRSEFCNIEVYDGEYQQYPQVHLGNQIQQCELMLRRGDRSCFDNVATTDLPAYSFPHPAEPGVNQVTHLKPGRGSVERAIKAIIVDSDTEWRHDGALAVAYRYYLRAGPTLDGLEQWPGELEGEARCAQDVCFGRLTHGLAKGETPLPPPTVAPPGADPPRP